MLKDMAVVRHWRSGPPAPTRSSEEGRLSAPKSGESGRVDMGPMLAACLQARQGVMAAETAVNGREPLPRVFPALGDHSRQLNAKSLQNAWTRLLTRAGLRHIRIHDLRHTYASSQLQAGETSQYVKQQLRHSTIKLTVGACTAT